MIKRMGTRQVLDRVLKRVTPSPREKERTERVVKESMGVAERVLKPGKAYPVLAGSYTRDTWMPDKKEFEIFMTFPDGIPREELEKKGLSLGKRIVKEMKGSFIIAYAEHPYVRAKIGGFMVDIVPCYGVKSAEKIRSAVDRTPFHNRYISENLRKGLSGEVRLLKRFCKGLGIYGSDTRTQGFSGYLCELLIIRYGGFLKLLREAGKWEPGAFIDLKDYHKGRVPQELRKRFRGQPLVVIDPVDRNRNVAAALSPRNFMLFASSCSGFLKSPGMEYFFPKRKRVRIRSLGKSIRERDSAFMLLRFRQPYVIQDVLWPQLRRFVKRLRNIMENEEFHVIGSGVWSDEEFARGGICLVLLELEVWELPDVRKVPGPPIFSKKHSAEFLKKYRPRGRTWVENQCWVAEVKREFASAEALLRHALSGRGKAMRERGVPSYIAKSIQKGFTVMKGPQILKMAGKRQEIGEFLKNYIDRNLSTV